MQRQTVFFGAKLDDKLWQLGGGLKSDERRFSLPRIADSDSDEDETWKPSGRDLVQQGMVRWVKIVTKF